jgi:predicted dehydrogenase
MNSSVPPNMASKEPTLRWGIIGTGLISSWFVRDLAFERPNPQAHHMIQAIGSSSLEKAQSFLQTHLPPSPASTQTPTLYGSYAEVYADPAVEIIYIGTPHAHHKQNCLDAIAHGKHVLCEKSFTLNAREARTVLDAAREKGVFVMEAMWTRFFPLVRTLSRVLHEEHAIGDILRVFCDFSLDQEIAFLGPESRLRNPALGAGSLLDIGIYSLTWGLVTLDPGVGDKAQRPKIVAAQSLIGGVVDVATSMVLLYPDGKQGVLTSNAALKSPLEFCRVEGTEGHVIVEGLAASIPRSFTVFAEDFPFEGVKYEFERPGRGFYWEADAVAVDIAAGRKENAIMPWAETLRVMEIMDEVRRQGGGRFPQDDE